MLQFKQQHHLSPSLKVKYFHTGPYLIDMDKGDSYCHTMMGPCTDVDVGGAPEIIQARWIFYPISSKCLHGKFVNIYCLHRDYKSDDRWCIKRNIGRKHIFQVQQSKIDCKACITAQEGIDGDVEIEQLGDGTEVIKIYNYCSG